MKRLSRATSCREVARHTVHIMRMRLSLALVLGCGSERPVTAAHAPEAPPPAPSEPAPVAASQPVAVPIAWRDFDALPPGALKRLGSQRLASNSRVAAIRDDGTLALVDDDLGIIEVRGDGMYRVIADDTCQYGATLVQYVGTELRANCNKTLYTLRGDVVSSAASPCEWGKSAIARSGEYFACTRDVE